MCYIIGWCNYCHQRLLSDLPYPTANLDDILCPYYGKQKLVYCSDECLEKDVKFVLEQLKQKAMHPKVLLCISRY